MVLHRERDHGVNVASASGDALRLGPGMRANAFSVPDLDREGILWRENFLFSFTEGAFRG